MVDPGATYHYHALYYVPSSEIVAGTYAVPAIRLSMMTAGAPFVVDDSTAPALTPDVWNVIEGDWVYPGTTVDQMNYMAFRLYGRAVAAPHGRQNVPGGYFDDCQFGLKTIGMNNRSVLKDALVVGKGVRTWGTCADATPSTGAVTAFTITDGYTTPVRVKWLPVSTLARPLRSMAKWPSSRVRSRPIQMVASSSLVVQAWIRRYRRSQSPRLPEQMDPFLRPQARPWLWAPTRRSPSRRTLAMFPIR